MRCKLFLTVLLCTLVLGSDFKSEIGTAQFDLSSFILGSSYSFSYQKMLHKRLSLQFGYSYSHMDFGLAAGDDNFMGFAFEPLEESYDVDFRLGRYNLLFLYHIMRDKEWLFFDTIGLGFARYYLQNDMQMTTTDGLVFKNRTTQVINGTNLFFNIFTYSPRPVPDLHLSTGFRFSSFTMQVPGEVTFELGDSTMTRDMAEEMGTDMPETFFVPLPEFFIGLSYTVKVR